MVEPLTFLYILELGDGSHYAGLTQALRRTLDAFAVGKGPWVTRTRGVSLVLLVAYFERKHVAQRIHAALARALYEGTPLPLHLLSTHAIYHYAPECPPDRVSGFGV